MISFSTIGLAASSSFLLLLLEAWATSAWTLPVTCLRTTNSQRALLPVSLDIDGGRSWLICGDGDLSFSALVTEKVDRDVSVTATVLEDEETHNSVYSNSRRHTATILDHHQQVMFGVDATQITKHFPSQKFDRIQFNFPHWRGKANNLRNRELLSNFLKSASQALMNDGEILVAFCEGQGGSDASDLQQWRQSWTAALYAAENGLLLKKVEPYHPIYDLSSHRGVDRPFRLGNEPKLYQFGYPNGINVPKEIQLCCWHELHVEIRNTYTSPRSLTIEDFVHRDAVKQYAQAHVAQNGVKVDVLLLDILTPAKVECTIVIFLIVYRGASVPMTRCLADTCRDQLETVLRKVVSLRENRLGRLVSRPFPYTALDALLKEQL